VQQPSPNGRSREQFYSIETHLGQYPPSGKLQIQDSTSRSWGCNARLSDLDSKSCSEDTINARLRRIQPTPTRWTFLLPLSMTICHLSLPSTALPFNMFFLLRHRPSCTAPRYPKPTFRKDFWYYSLQYNHRRKTKQHHQEQLALSTKHQVVHTYEVRRSPRLKEKNDVLPTKASHPKKQKPTTRSSLLCYATRRLSASKVQRQRMPKLCPIRFWRLVPSHCLRQKYCR
jgi:hypothetical protein